MRGGCRAGDESEGAANCGDPRRLPSSPITMECSSSDRKNRKSPPMKLGLMAAPLLRASRTRPSYPNLVLSYAYEGLGDV